MRGIKIPPQDFALKMQGGGLIREGGVFAGHYNIIMHCGQTSPSLDCLTDYCKTKLRKCLMSDHYFMPCKCI